MLPPITTFWDKWGPVRYFMAPMAGITDSTFRTLIRELGAEVVISELVSSEGLRRGGQRTRDLMAFCEAERPVGIQIFGCDIESMTDGARIVQDAGADFVDINFGCPVKKVVSDGGGSAWLKDPVALGKLLTSMKGVLNIPLTIKIRTGWDSDSVNAHEVVSVAADCGVDWVAIHGRTRAQGYAGSADWDYIREVARAAGIPVIGNGDILTAEQARSRVENGDAHGVMVGRGVLKNPWIFKELAGDTEREPFVNLIERHFALAVENKGEQRAFLSLKKFMAWYASGYPGASAFRRSIFAEIKDIETLRSYCGDYFARNARFEKVDDGKPFLMGGHG